MVGYASQTPLASKNPQLCRYYYCIFSFVKAFDFIGGVDAKLWCDALGPIITGTCDPKSMAGLNEFKSNQTDFNRCIFTTLVLASASSFTSNML